MGEVDKARETLTVALGVPPEHVSADTLMWDKTAWREADAGENAVGRT